MNDELKPGDIVELLNLTELQAVGMKDPKFYIGMKFKIFMVYPVGTHPWPHTMYELDGFAPNGGALFWGSQLLKIQLNPDKNSP